MTTRIVVVADTHLSRGRREVPPQVLKAAREADLIVHLGDFTSIEAADLFESLGDLAAVHGNNDSPDVRARYPAAARLDVNGHRIVLIHGHAGERTAFEAAQGIEDADIVLFGHSHTARSVRQDGRLLFNPGSPTDRRFAPHRTFGILDIGEEVAASIVNLT